MEPEPHHVEPKSADGWVTIAKRELGDISAGLKGGGSMASAYYHAGMAFEALLKAYLWKKLRWNAFPSRQAARYLYYHDLEAMLKETGLEDQMRAEPEIWASWQTVREWSQVPRYSDGEMPRQVAFSMTKSVRHPDFGVFPWLMKRYQKLA